MRSAWRRWLPSTKHTAGSSAASRLCLSNLVRTSILLSQGRTFSQAGKAHGCGRPTHAHVQHLLCSSSSSVASHA